MPQFAFTTVLAGNGVAVPLSNWQYEYLPFPAYVEIGLKATTAAVVATVTSGSDTLQEESPVQGGGTAGVTPSPLNTTFLTDQAAAGDRLKIKLRETAGAAATVDGIVKITPLAGRRR